MNSKFFDVKKEKQDNIINAALRIFSAKGYKDASTDVIVKEAGISKGLLFHYFINKKGLYEFICDYSTKYMTLELTRSVKATEKDFFEILSQIEMGRCRVARNYPYMQQFLRSARFEKDEEAVDALGTSLKDLDITYSNIYSQINPNKFINPQDSDQIIKIIDWINDGFVKDKLNEGEHTPDEMFEEFNSILELMRRHFYKSDSNEHLSIAKEEVYERDDTIMDSMRMEMTFEERLMAGKRPLVEMSEEELQKLKEEESQEESTEKSSEELDESINDDNDKAVDNTLEATDDDAVENIADKVDEADNDSNEANIAESLEEEGFLDDDYEEEESPLGLPKVATANIAPVRNIEPVMPTFEAQPIVVTTPLNPAATGHEEEKHESIEDIISEAEHNLNNN